MCSPAVCPRCRKMTYSGCGMHVEQIFAGVPRERRVLVHCKSGYRSMTAVSLLQKHGYANAVDVEGGFDAWVEAGLAVSGEAACS